ncbi:hypothetical protein AALA49_06730, partial [Streptococcus alactolyticus]|uniref:hypothetical protein n=1 Tax=Streptococcus alactolyticus TaxID=29389 RepID=UPI0035179FC9
GLFFYTKKGSIISTVDLPTTEIIEPFCLEIASCFDACLFGENACSHFPTRTVVLSKRCASVRLKMAGRDAII